MELARWFTDGWERAYERRASGCGPDIPEDEYRRMVYARKRGDISFARENDQRVANGKDRLWDGSTASLVAA